MSALLGYDRGTQYFNDMESRNKQLQASISRVNQSNLNNYNTAEAIKQRTDKVREQGAEARESKGFLTDAKEGAGELLAEGRNVYKLGKSLNESRQGVQSAITTYRRNRFIDAGGGRDPTGEGTGALEGQIAENREPELRPGGEDAAREPLLPGGEGDADVNAVLDFGDRLGDRVVGAAGEVAGRVAARVAAPVGEVAGAVRDATQGISDTARAVGAGDVAGAVDAGSRVLNAGKFGLRALDSIGKTAEGLNVVSGVGDILDDMDGGYAKMNSNEKVGNVAGIISAGTSAAGLAAGLEGTGAMLDATGVGAPVGLALGLAGVVAGGVSAVEDYIGGKKKQKQQTKPGAPIKKPTPVAAANVPISPLQSGGVAMSGYN